MGKCNVAYVPVCPPLTGYTDAEQNAVADAMESEPDAPWWKMIENYGKLRKTIRETCER